MAKTLTLLSTTISSATQGRDFTVPNVAIKTEVTAADATKFACVYEVLRFGDGRGRADLTLKDNTGSSVLNIVGKFADSPRIHLSTEAGAAGAGSNNAGLFGHWIIDAASFSTGSVELEMHGKLHVSPKSVVIGGAASYQEIRDSAGVWMIQYNFTVSE